MKESVTFIELCSEYMKAIELINLTDRHSVVIKKMASLYHSSAHFSELQTFK